MTTNLTRRTFLTLSSTTFIAALAGCTRLSGDEPPTVTIDNGFPREITLTLTIHHSTDEFPAYEETFTLAADESRQLPNPMTSAGTYEIRVIVEDTFDESYEWTISENGAPNLSLDVRPDGMELADAGR